MPKMKRTAEEIADAELVGDIKGAMAKYGYSAYEVALSIGVSIGTFYLRLKKPGSFTKRELEKIKRKLHFTDEHFMKYIA